MIKVDRKTNETDISVSLDIYGTGVADIQTGVPFLNHMLDQIARHGLMDLTIRCDGDTEIDDHHTVEDIGITIGQAFFKAVGDKKGLTRYGHSYVPLDEALSRVVLDLSGRPGLIMDVDFTRGRVGTFDVDLIREFFQGFVNHALVTLHIDNMKGVNSHHQAETVFKAFGRALRMAVTPDERQAGVIPSTKGSLQLFRGMQTIAIVDYGMGNVRSVQKAFEFVAPNDHSILTNDPELINDADRIVFPGQGAMGACMSALNEHNLVDVIKKAASEKPFLGICLGLQLLFDHSEENNGTDGLSIISGKVVKFANSDLKIPHMGWNTVNQVSSHPLWHNIDNNARFYSVHSYYVQQEDSSVVTGNTDYGDVFTSAVAKDSLFAVQFHPEKSQHDGLQLLKNFVDWQ